MCTILISGVVAHPDNWDGLVADGLARWRLARAAGVPVVVRARVSGEPVKLRSGFSLDHAERWVLTERGESVLNDKSIFVDKILVGVGVMDD